MLATEHQVAAGVIQVLNEKIKKIPTKHRSQLGTDSHLYSLPFMFV